MFEAQHGAEREGTVRQIFFITGLLLLLGSSIAFIWIQKPLRQSAQEQHLLAKNVGRVMTLDEILTMSARMAASARDSSYEARYNEHVAELDGLIKTTIGLIPDDQVAAALRETDAANLRLVDMETKSFELDKGNRYVEALALLESSAYKADKATYANGMARAFLRLEQLTQARKAAVERWAVTFQVIGVASLLLVLGAWTSEQRARRKQAARYAASLETTVEQRTQELAQRNEAMRIVLDNVQQGLLSVDLTGRMSSERSAVVDGWFGKVGERTELGAYLRDHDPDFANWFELGLEQLREGVLPPEVCIGQMPHRLHLGERTIAVEYEPIFKAGKQESLLLVMSDISAAIETQRVEIEQRDLVRVLEHIARDRTGFLNFLDEATHLVIEINSAASDSAHLGRSLHTLKGTAAQFGMSVIADTCHQLEERLREQGDLSPKERDDLVANWQTLRARIRSILGDRSQSHIEVERKDYASLLALVERRGSYDEIVRTLRGWELDPAQARLERLAEYGQALASRLGKPVPEVVCDGGGVRVNNTLWAPLWSACVHLVRNAVDHGLETPTEREALAKDARGKLTLSAKTEDQSVVLKFSDDGRGVQWDKVARKAASLGVPFQTEAERTEALFRDGLSSLDFETDVSGRGIGMAAVREQVSRFGGAIKLITEQGHGTTIELRFPANRMVPTPRSERGVV